MTYFKDKKYKAGENKCKEKKTFETLQEAKNKSLDVKNESQILLYPYKCNVCNKFHLTKNNPQQQKKVRKKLGKSQAMIDNLYKLKKENWINDQIEYFKRKHQW